MPRAGVLAPVRRDQGVEKERHVPAQLRLVERGGGEPFAESCKEIFRGKQHPVLYHQRDRDRGSDWLG